MRSGWAARDASGDSTSIKAPRRFSAAREYRRAPVPNVLGLVAQQCPVCIIGLTWRSRLCRRVPTASLIKRRFSASANAGHRAHWTSSCRYRGHHPGHLRLVISGLPDCWRSRAQPRPVHGLTYGSSTAGRRSSSRGFSMMLAARS